MLLTIADLQGILIGSQSMRGIKLDARTWLAIIQVQRLAQQRIEEYDLARIQLCEQYAKKDDKGNYIMITGADGRPAYDIEDMRAFTIELQKLQNESVDLAMPQIKIRLKEVPVIDNPEGLILLTMLNIDGDDLFEEEKSE